MRPTLLVLSVVLLLSGCVPAPTATPLPVFAAIAATEIPTLTPKPSPFPSSTATPSPTNTPPPSATATERATATRVATVTATLIPTELGTGKFAGWIKDNQGITPNFGNHTLYQAYPTDEFFTRNTVTGVIDSYQVIATLIGEHIDAAGNHLIQWAWLKADKTTTVYFYTYDKTTTHDGKGFNAAATQKVHPEVGLNITIKDLLPGLTGGLTFMPDEFKKLQNNTGQPLSMWTENTGNLNTYPLPLLPISPPSKE